MIGGTSDPTLQVMAERPDTRQLDARRLRRHFAPAVRDARRLEAEGRDPIEGGYRLEVSSPGIDRPLTRPHGLSPTGPGHEARIKFAEPIDGAKQVSGIIEGIDGDTVRIATPKGEREVPFANPSRRPSCS